MTNASRFSQFDWITNQEQFKVRLQLISKTDNLTRLPL